MTTNLEGPQLRFLRWDLKRFPAMTLAKKLREAAERYERDDPLANELSAVTDETIQEWEQGTRPMPPRVVNVVLRILGFPKEFLLPSFIEYCRREGLSQLSTLHLGRLALHRGQFRGSADSKAWKAIAETVIGPEFQGASQAALWDEYLCQNCGYYNPEVNYLICPECGVGACR